MLKRSCKIKRILISSIVCILIFASLSTSAFAANFFGSSVEVDMRYDFSYLCRCPADTSYCYFYFLEGEGQDFTWIDARYICVWSRERLIIQDNQLLISDDYYYFYSNNLDTLKNLFFQNKIGTTTLMKASSLSFNSINVIYSNKSYIVDGTSYDVNWPYSIDSSLTAALSSIINNVYVSLKSNGITIAGSKISFFTLLVGPFGVSIALFILSTVLDFGGAKGKEVRESKNTKKKKEGE